MAERPEDVHGLQTTRVEGLAPFPEMWIGTPADQVEVRVETGIIAAVETIIVRFGRHLREAVEIGIDTAETAHDLLTAADIVTIRRGGKRRTISRCLVGRRTWFRMSSSSSWTQLIRKSPLLPLWWCID